MLAAGPAAKGCAQVTAAETREPWRCDTRNGVGWSFDCVVKIRLRGGVRALYNPSRVCMLPLTKLALGASPIARPNLLEYLPVLDEPAGAWKISSRRGPPNENANQLQAL